MENEARLSREWPGFVSRVTGTWDWSDRGLWPCSGPMAALFSPAAAASVRCGIRALLRGVNRRGAAGLTGAQPPVRHTHTYTRVCFITLMYKIKYVCDMIICSLFSLVTVSNLYTCLSLLLYTWMIWHIFGLMM